MRNAINWMMFFEEDKTVYSKLKKTSFKFKLNFITLTLAAPQHHTDEFILHHMLFPFLKYLERKWQVTAYVWRAEIQEKRYYERGERCIHFHITTGRFVHYSSINKKWNQLQLAHGYRNADENPNGTDVHSVRHTGKIVSYMAKYITKQIEDENLKVNCKIFGMSRNLSRMKILLREEETNNYNSLVEEFLRDNTQEIMLTDHGKIYFHQLSRRSKLPSELQLIFSKLREEYFKGVVLQKRFEI